MRGRPLTGFGRGRPNLPLPLERVKNRRAIEGETGFCKGFLKGEGERGGALEGEGLTGGVLGAVWVRGRLLTGFGRGRPNLPLPLERPLRNPGGGCPEDPSPNSAEDGRFCLSPWRG